MPTGEQSAARSRSVTPGTSAPRVGALGAKNPEESTMAYALDSGVRGALNDAYQRRLQAEAEAAGGPPKRTTPALGIPNPTRGRAAAMPRRQSSSDKTQAFDFGEPKSAVAPGVEEQGPSTQNFGPNHPAPQGGPPNPKKTLAYNNRDELDRALAEAGVQAPGAESERAQMKRTMAYALSGDQFDAVRKEAVAAAKAEAQAALAKKKGATTAPSRNKARLKSTMAFLPPATGSAPDAAAPAALPDARPPVALPSVGGRAPEPSAPGAPSLGSTMAFNAGIADEPTGSRGPYLSRPEESDGVNLGATLVAGVGPGAGVSRPQDSEVTRLSPGLASGQGAPATPAPMIAVQEAAPERAPQAAHGIGAAGYAPAPAAPLQQVQGGVEQAGIGQPAVGQAGAAGQAGYPAAPAAGSVPGPATVALPDTAQHGFVRPPMAMAPPPAAPLVQAQPVQVTSAPNKTPLLVAIVVGVVMFSAVLGGVVFWLLK